MEQSFSAQLASKNKKDSIPKKNLQRDFEDTSAALLPYRQYKGMKTQ